jgi:large subunit ribosomal protein L1
LNFPPEDVIKNVRHFLTAVKKVTGSEKEAASKGAKAENKPVIPIIKVMLSSTQGPGIQLSDF